MFEVHNTGTVPSVLDTAWQAVAEGRLNVFDSILAAAQTAGRGQYRRNWHSPEGNLYAALRLPGTPPFLGLDCRCPLQSGLPCFPKVAQ